MVYLSLSLWYKRFPIPCFLKKWTSLIGMLPTKSCDSACDNKAEPLKSSSYPIVTTRVYTQVRKELHLHIHPHPNHLEALIRACHHHALIISIELLWFFKHILLETFILNHLSFDLKMPQQKYRFSLWHVSTGTNNYTWGIHTSRSYHVPKGRHENPNPFRILSGLFETSKIHATVPNFLFETIIKLIGPF